MGLTPMQLSECRVRGGFEIPIQSLAANRLYDALHCDTRTEMTRLSGEQNGEGEIVDTEFNQKSHQKVKL